MNQLNDYIETGNGIIQTIQTNYPTTFNWLDSTKADTLHRYATAGGSPPNFGTKLHPTRGGFGAVALRERGDYP